MTRHGKNCTAGAVYTYHEKRKDTGGYLMADKGGLWGDGNGVARALTPKREASVSGSHFRSDLNGYGAVIGGPIDPYGFLWVPMGVYGVSMGPYSITIDLYGTLWVPMGLYGVSMGPYGFLWVPMGFYVSLWGPYGSLWVSMGPYGFLWVPMGRSGAEALCPIAEATPGTSGTLPSFWIPSLTPEAGAERLRKPDTSVRCPMSGRRLRASDLVPVHFTPEVPGLERLQLLGRRHRFVCAVSRDALSNATPCAVIRPSGAVVTMQCVERLIRKEMRDPISGETLSDDDIIPLQRGGTGFAACRDPQLELHRKSPRQSC
ncbi:nitric oxide synthase-interacting protein [Coturnix japonica]|uniref:nitric oxide synthase-interacting protein n=1 Tax=Coturnix japonica TaxID=93934 RepID=UPI000776BDA8|nr:nitric oxide synthase-interacting protein [Coturnix japonica]